MKNISLILFLFVQFVAFGQADSSRHPNHDSSRPKADSAALIPNNQKDSLKKDSSNVDSLAAKKPVQPAQVNWNENDTAFSKLLTVSFNKLQATRQLMPAEAHISNSKDELFYILAGLFLFLGLIRTAYPKYFQNVFRLFFQASLRQKQTPEQITQGYIPGLLLNVLFFVVAGMFIAIYCANQRWLPGPLWLSIIYCSVLLACIYVIKYVVTLFAGWVFNASVAASTYSFIIFLINRVMGIILLPLLVLLCFYSSGLQAVIFTIAASIVIFMLIYRYAMSLTVRKNLKVSALHFFIYLCAVELMPLLVIYKVLFNQVA